MIYRELNKIIKYRAVTFFVFFFLLIVSAMNVSVLYEPDVISSKESFANFNPINIKEIDKYELETSFSLPTILSEIDSFKNREDFIKKSIENIDKKLKLPIISQKEKKLLRIEKDSLENILEMDLKITHTAYFSNYINNIKSMGFLILCLFIFIFYYIFYQDIENSLISLYKTYSLSLKKLYIYKCVAFLILSFTIAFIWGVIDYIFLLISDTDPGIFIQNINGFYLAPLKFTLLEYIILNIGLIYLIIIFLIVLFSFLLFFLKRVGFAIIGLFSFILIEYNWYNNIALGSSKEILKLFNIFSLVERPFSQIIPSNIIISNQIEYIVIPGFILLTIVFLVLSYISYAKGTSRKSKFGTIFKGMNTNNIVINEAYNILLESKGILILIILIIFSYVSYKDFYYVRPYNYESISIEKRNYYGKIDENLLEKLHKDIKEAEYYNNRSYELLEKDVRSEEEENELRNIHNFIGKYQDLGVIYDEITLARANGASFYVDTEATNFLHSVKKNYNFFKDTFIGFCLIGLITSLYISSNYNSKIEKLFGTMKRIKSRNLVRLILLYMVCLTIFAIFIWTHIMKLNKGFNYSILDISINNLFPISSTMNYRVFLGLTLFSYILLICTIVNVNYYISIRNSIINSFMISLFISILLMLAYVLFSGYSPISIIRYEIFNNIYIYIAYIIIYIGINIWILKKNLDEDWNILLKYYTKNS